MMSTTTENRPHAAADEAPDLSSHDRAIHELCERWVNWQRTRRLYGPKPLTGTILGRLSGTSMRPLHPDGPDAISSAELSAFHIAYTCQPDALDKRVFDAYYVYRVKPVKAAAAALGIGRGHYYEVLRNFSRRVAAAAKAIEAENAQAAQAMRQRLAANDTSNH
jgi:hypothetical protein